VSATQEIHLIVFIKIKIMKKIISILYLLTYLHISILSHSQSIDRSVIASGGGYYTSANASLSWTLGESVTQTFQSAVNTLTQGFQQPYRLNVNLKYFIQGYYDAAGLMRPVLYNQGQPNAITDADTVTIELHNITAPFAMAHTFTGVLKTDGTIACLFPNASEGQTYYIGLKHRNAVQTWSANPVTLSNVVYDFTTHANKAYGDNQVLVDANIYAIYSGDINLDENADLVDLNSIESDITTFAYGYIATDINGDGNVDLLDSPIEEVNINNFIYAMHP